MGVKVQVERVKREEKLPTGRESLLGHGECQVVIGHLDLVLSLQMSHSLCADAIDGNDDIALDQVALSGLTAWSDLSNTHMDTLASDCRRLDTVMCQTPSHEEQLGQIKGTK